MMMMLPEHGSFEQALHELSPEEEVGLGDFKRNACRCFGVTDMEAEMLFRNIDLDGGGEVSQDEIRRAVNLAEVSLDLEDCRRKLRQGYRTIQAAFHEAYASPEEEEGIPNVFYFKVDEFADVLRPLGLGKRNVTRLVALMGVSEQGVTLSEFFSGARLFAPSVALEELKMQLLQTHKTLEAAFRNIKDRRAPVKRHAFKVLLEELGAQCDGEDQIFDFLDIRSTGVTTVSEILAALQCLQSGRHKLLSQIDRNDKVKKNVGQIFEPAHRYASELKARVKGKGENGEAAPDSGADDDDLNGTRKSAGRAKDSSPKASASMRQALNAASKQTHSKPTVPRAPMVKEGSDNIPRHVLARTTFQKVTSTLQVLPPSQEQKTVQALTIYFDSNETALSEQRRLVTKNYHRMEERRIVEKLKKGDPAAAMQ